MRKHTTFHLRILFGPLFGVDIILPCDDVFFCVGGNSEELSSLNSKDIAHSLHQAIDTLYIPHRSHGPNFKLRIAASRYREKESKNKIDSKLETMDYAVNLVSPDGGMTLHEKFNHIFQHGDIRIAVKPANEEWSDEVRNFTAQPEQLPSPHQANAERGERSFGFKSCIAVIVGAVAIATVYSYMNECGRTKKVARVTRLLAHTPIRNDVLPGRDGKIYIVSATLDGLDWATWKVKKAAASESIQIVSAQAEQARLEHTLDKQGVDFFTVRMDEPQCPVLLVSPNISQPARDATVGLLMNCALRPTSAFAVPKHGHDRDGCGQCAAENWVALPSRRPSTWHNFRNLRRDRRRAICFFAKTLFVIQPQVGHASSRLQNRDADRHTKRQKLLGRKGRLCPAQSRILVFPSTS